MAKPARRFIDRWWVKYLLLPLVVLVAGELIVSTLLELRPLVLLGRLFAWLYHAQVPLLVFLAFLVVTLWQIVRGLRLGRQSVATLKDPEEESKTESPRAKEFVLTEEHSFLLFIVAQVPDDISDRSLYDLYRKTFPSNNRLDFNLLIDDLVNAEMINASTFINGEKYYNILPKGLDKLREAKARMKSANR